MTATAEFDIIDPLLLETPPDNVFLFVTRCHTICHSDVTVTRLHNAMTAAFLN